MREKSQQRLKNEVKAGLQNINKTCSPLRSGIWPTEAFYLARKPQNFIHWACLCEKTPSEWVQTYGFWPLNLPKKIWGPLEI